jgi:hypothetical protein
MVTSIYLTPVKAQEENGETSSDGMTEVWVGEHLIWREPNLHVFLPNGFVQLNWEEPYLNHSSSANSASGKSSGSFDETYSAIFFKTEGALYEVRIIIEWASVKRQKVVLIGQGNGRNLHTGERVIEAKALTLIIGQVSTEKWPDYPTAEEVDAVAENRSKRERQEDRAFLQDNFIGMYAGFGLNTIFNVVVCVGVVAMVNKLYSRPKNDLGRKRGSFGR